MIVVEYSLSQKAFHCYDIQEMVENNFKNVMNRNQTDYVPIGIFVSKEKADNFILENKERIKDYSLYKSFEGETLTVNY